MRRRAALGALAVLAACDSAGFAPAESARLPPGSVEGAGDPIRAAVSRSAYAFTTGGFPGRPGMAARSVADMEYLAVSLPTDPRYSRDPLLGVRLQQARAEWRAVLGIPPDAPAQAVINRFWPIYEAEQSGQPLRDDPALLARLAALPRLPRTAEAANAAALVQANPDIGRQNFFRPR